MDIRVISELQDVFVSEVRGAFGFLRQHGFSIQEPEYFPFSCVMRIARGQKQIVIEFDGRDGFISVVLFDSQDAAQASGASLLEYLIHKGFRGGLMKGVSAPLLREPAVRMTVQAYAQALCERGGDFYLQIGPGYSGVGDPPALAP